MLTNTMANLRTEWRHDIVAGMALLAMLALAVVVLKLPGSHVATPAATPVIQTSDVAVALCSPSSLADC